RQHAKAEALKQWQVALDSDSGYVPALIAMATDAFDRGHPEDAEGYILSVVRAEPANFDALMLYARVLTGRQRYDAAMAITRRAMAARPNAPDPHVVMGEVALKRSKPAEALLEFEKAVALDGRASGAYSGLTRVFREGVIDRAMLHKMEETAGKN